MKQTLTPNLIQDTFCNRDHLAMGKSVFSNWVYKHFRTDNMGISVDFLFQFDFDFVKKRFHKFKVKLQNKDLWNAKKIQK